MKKTIFNQYVKEVCRLFDIEPSQLFTRTRKRKIVEARQLVHYLCYNRSMGLTEISEYMEQSGLSLTPANISNGVNRVREKIRYDDDYEYVINKIKGCATP